MAARKPLETKPCEKCGVIMQRKRLEACADFAKSRFCSVACGKRNALRGKVSTEERFWHHVKKRGDDECWPHARYLKGGKESYCQVSTPDGPVPLSRIACGMENGPAPTDQHYACHKCDFRPCCNPKHLFWGTAVENTRDMYSKGRNGKPSNQIVTDEMVNAIRIDLRRAPDIAEEHGVSIWTIHKIRAGTRGRSVSITQQQLSQNPTLRGKTLPHQCLEEFERASVEYPSPSQLFPCQDLPLAGLFFRQVPVRPLSLA